MDMDQAAQEAGWRQVAQACMLAGQVQEHAFGPERAVWMQRLLDQQARCIEALDWLYRQGQAGRGLELCLLLEELWFEDAYTSLGRQWFERFLALPAPPDRAALALRAQALDLAGALAINQEDYSSATHLKEEGLAILRQLDDPVTTAFALIHLGHLVGFVSGDFITAQALYQEALDLLQSSTISASVSTGQDPASADDRARLAGIAHACANLASMAILQRRYDSAAGLVEESLQRYQALDDAYNLALSVWRAAGVLAGMGQPEQAMRLAGAGAAHMAAVGIVQPPVYQRCYDAMLAPARQALDSTLQSGLWAEGQAWSLELACAAAREALASSHS